jgi:flagellar hook-associated protein 2
MSSTSGINSLLSSATASSSVDLSSILASATGATTPGINVSAAVTAAIYAARGPERAWQAQQATLTAQTAALTVIQTATSALTTDMNALNGLTGPLSRRVVSSSNSSDLTATAATGTVAGSHSVNIINTAQTGAWYTDLASSPTASVPATSFTLTSGSGSATFSTGSGINSLQDLAAAINSNTSLGVNATVVTGSSGSRLAILSSASGTAADFSITSVPYTGTNWSSPNIPVGGSLGANSFTLSSGSASATIATTAGESYAALAASINAITPSLNVVASAVTDTHGTHLSIVSSDGSTPFAISEPSFNFSQAVVGADASLTVDGVPVTSANNTVTGAIPGVTLQLLGATTGAANLTVASDASGISTAINQFVTDYNTAIGLVNSQFVYNASTASQGLLGSDPSVRALQSSLMSALNYVSTPASGTTSTPTLASLGINVGSDGTLTVDTATLNSALVNNPTDVQDFFQGASLNGFAASVNTALSNYTDPSSGAFTVDLKSLSNTNADLTKQINNFESTYIASQQTLLTAMYSKAEIALQQLPTQMAQLQAMLGNNTKNGG